MLVIMMIVLLKRQWHINQQNIISNHMPKQLIGQTVIVVAKVKQGVRFRVLLK